MAERMTPRTPLQPCIARVFIHANRAWAEVHRAQYSRQDGIPWQIVHTWQGFVIVRSDQTI